MEYREISLLDELGIGEVSHDTIKEQLKKINKVHNVIKKSTNLADLPLGERLDLITTEVYKTLGRYKGFVKLIKSYDELKAYIELAKNCGYLTLDTETNNSLDPLTCKIMGLCLYIPNTKPVYVPMNHTIPGTEMRLDWQVTEEQAAELLKDAANSNVKFVYHNGKFDIRVCKNTLGFYLPIYWDTMLAAQVIDENEKAGLKPQYKNHIDPTIGTYNIEKLFAGIPYAWVDPEVFALYAAIDAYDTWTLMQYQLDLLSDPSYSRMLKLITEIEFPTTLVVAKMEDDGIPFDMEFTSKLNDKYNKSMNECYEKLLDMLKPYQQVIDRFIAEGKLENPVNFNSPSQLQILFYDVLKVPVPANGRSTDKDSLKAMDNDFAKMLLEYRHYNKMITSFTSTLPELRSKKDGKIHASFNQMGKEENNVRTGRFSSTDPNLQQIPSKEKVMRLMFKASPGYVIVGGDYSQQEPRLLTHLSKDPKLIETYNNNRDLYATIAAEVLHKDYWECMEHWEDGTPNPDGKATRSKAKGLVLGIMYGMGAKLMSSILGVDVEQCKKILAEFYKMFPTIKKYTESVEEKAKALGYVEDYIGRRRHLPDINLPQLTINIHKHPDIDVSSLLDIDNNSKEVKEFKIPDPETTNKLYEEYNKLMQGEYQYNIKDKFKKQLLQDGYSEDDFRDNGAFISRASTQCTNATIQGSAATLTKKAMVRIFNDKRLQEIGFRLLIPVHDELLGECPIEHAEECEKLLAKAMIEAAKPECSVNMKVDTYCVKHWYSDEVANGIAEAFHKYLKGDTKTNTPPITEEEAYDKLCKKYSELSRDTVILMCNEKFDHINGHL